MARIVAQHDSADQKEDVTGDFKNSQSQCVSKGLRPYERSSHRMPQFICGSCDDRALTTRLLLD